MLWLQWLHLYTGHSAWSDTRAQKILRGRTMRPTPEQVQQIREQLSKITQGSWMTTRYQGGFSFGGKKRAYCGTDEEFGEPRAMPDTEEDHIFVADAPQNTKLLLNEIDALNKEISDTHRRHWQLFKEFAEKSDHNMCICCSAIYPKSGPSPHAK